jgi:hypothetical protein
LYWDESRQLYSEIGNQLQFSKFIHITAPVLSVRLDEIDWQYCIFKIDMLDGCYIRWSLKLDRRENFDHTSSKALCLKEGIDGRANDVFVMIISSGDNSFERVGGGWVTSWVNTLYSQDDVKFQGDHAIADRYGKQWAEHLVRTYDTFRIG